MLWFTIPLLAGCASEPALRVPPPTVAQPTDTAASSRVSAVAAKERESDGDKAWDPVSFRTAINEGLEAILSNDPELATSKGDHRFDDRFSDLDESSQAKLAKDFAARAEG